MKFFIAHLTLFLFTGIAHAESVNFSFICELIGTTLTGKQTQVLKESFSHEIVERTTKNGIKYSYKETKFVSNDITYKAEIAFLTKDNIVFITTGASQEDSKKKTQIYMFSINLSSLILDRSIVTLLDSSLYQEPKHEHGICKKAG